MNARKLKKRIEHTEIRDLSEAVHEASRRGRSLNALITIHPGFMTDRPDDLGLFFRRAARNYIAIWLRRRGHPFWAIWVRENYEDENREHLHLMSHIPNGMQDELAMAMATWWPGSRATNIKPIWDDEQRETFGYIGKQLSSKAQYVTRPKSGGWPAIRYEKVSRRTGDPVAPVLGKKCGITNDLKKAMQERRSRAARLQAQAAAQAVA
jgi:hypothetical protein